MVAPHGEGRNESECWYATLRQKTPPSNHRSDLEQQVMQRNQRHGTQPELFDQAARLILVPSLSREKISEGRGTFPWWMFRGMNAPKRKTPRQAGAFAAVRAD